LTMISMEWYVITKTVLQMSHTVNELKFKYKSSSPLFKTTVSITV